MLKSKHIYLRKLQSTDTELMLKWENNIDNWAVTGTSQPFTKEEIEIFVNGNHDLITEKQIRYVICLNAIKKAIGTIDLFEYDNQNKVIGVGVLIAEEENRGKGFAIEALRLIIDYCRNELNVVNLFCNITKDNIASIRLFEKCSFQFIEERTLFEETVNYYELKFLLH